MGSRDIWKVIEAIDAFMERDKLLVVPPEVTWQRGRDDNMARLKLPIQVDGELSGQYLLLDAFPNSSTLYFSIGLVLFDCVVCRVDWVEDEPHTNKLSRYHGSTPIPSIFRGPHWHSWELNKHSYRVINEHLKLPYAVPLDPNIRKFDSTLRWYCGVRRIQLGAHGIEYPLREVLL